MTPEPVVIRLPVSDEWPHAPQADPDWQESVVLAFQDPSSRVGGFIRIGHHPNRGTGNCTFGVVDPMGGFNRSRQDVPMRADDRTAQGFAIDGFLTATFEDGRSRWRAADADCELDFEVRDLHPLYDTWALSGLTGGFRDNFAASHTEVAGRAKGRLRIGGRTYEIDGFGYRDHSWGVRRMDAPESALSNFFWLVGAFGEDFAFALVEIVLRSGKRTKMGFVLKDGEADIPRVRDLSFVTELDGLCMRGARCTFDTRKFGAFSFEVEGFGNVLLGMEQRYLEFGMPGRVLWEGRTGGAHLSTLFNARNGEGRPPLLFGGSQDNGLYERRPFATAHEP
jgi:hypothetical protein